MMGSMEVTTTVEGWEAGGEVGVGDVEAAAEAAGSLASMATDAGCSSAMVAARSAGPLLCRALLFTILLCC